MQAGHLYWCGRNVFVRRYDTLVLNREQILAIAARHGARNVRIFGSVARGEDTPESDVDLLVEFEPGRGLLNHAALIEELQNLLGCKVDVASHNGLKPRIRQRVIEEAVVL
jgi:predicted nucleotidyltransferase